jgi:hypothetical protein
LLRLAAEPRPGFGTGWESGSGTDSTACLVVVTPFGSVARLRVCRRTNE